MDEPKRGKIGVTVKLEETTIELLRDIGLVRGVPGISPMIENIIENYLKNSPLVAKEKEILKFLKDNPKKFRPSAPSNRKKS